MSNEIVVMTIDPLGIEDKTDGLMKRIMSSVGVLPTWASMAFEAGCDDARSVFEAMVGMYCMGEYEFSGGTVLGDGTYSYRDDPNLYPLIQMECGAVTIYFYLYAMFAIVGPDEIIVTRMD